MNYLRFHNMSVFAHQIAQTDAWLAVERPDGIVARALVDNDPEGYGGLFAMTGLFARLALLEKGEGVVILLASKVADHLRGERDAIGFVRPTLEGLQRSYVLSALRHQPGGPLLPPHRAEHLKVKIDIYSEKMQRHNSDMFTLYATRIGDQTIFANNYVSYVIAPTGQERYSVRFIAPLRKHWDRENSKSLVGAFSRSLMQKSLGTKLSRAEADLVLMKHWRDVSSELWEGRVPHNGQGVPMYIAKLATQLGRYPKDHGLGMGAAILVAGGFMMAKDKHMLAAAIAGFSVLHAVADVTLKGALVRVVDSINDRLESKKAQDISRYGNYEDAVRFLLDPSPGNLKRPFPHLDLKRFNPKDFRFLTTEEVGAMLPAHGRFEKNLRPSSLFGLALFGDKRGFTSTAIYPAPRTRINIYQTGMLTLKHARGDGIIDMFVVYRPEYCLRDVLRLPPAYIKQINQGGTGIQHIVYDKNAEAFGSSYTQKPVIYAQMQEILKPGLFAKHSSSTNFFTPTAQSYQKEAWECIGHYFDVKPSRMRLPHAFVVPSMFTMS